MTVGQPPWSLEARTVARDLDTTPASGLTTTEAAVRLAEHGPNLMPESDRHSMLALLVRQLTNTMTAVLAVAAGITFVVGDVKDTIVITTIVAMNTIIGFAQESRAVRAMAALERMTAPDATVRRDGSERRVPMATLVPGDVVVLAAGDVVPADARIWEAVSLRVDEAALTGESVPVLKDSADLGPAAAAPPVGDQRNMAFRGTAITHGRGIGLVTATGPHTELGRIASLLEGASAGATPLQQRLASLGRLLALAAVSVCAIVFGTGVAAGEPVADMFLVAVSLAVAAIPEGLPAVVTVALALGAQRMAARQAVVRRLPAVETLGSVSVICSDKTGTLTENRMVVERVWTPTATYQVTGTGYTPDGDLRRLEGGGRDPLIEPLARAAAFNNDAVLHRPAAGESAWSMTGDPTEAALLALTGKIAADVDPTRPRERAAEVPFDARTRHMTTVHRTRSGRDGWWLIVKGALDALGPMLAADQRPRLDAAKRAAGRLADQGYRVLALADRRLESLPSDLVAAEHELRLLGIVGIADPPRRVAAEAIATCREAGITPVMITGDHPRTARAIAERLGLLDADSVLSGVPRRAGAAPVLTGAELAALNDSELQDRVADVRVFARTDPEQKLRIVQAWQARGATVAMTGDGVNDAPALRQSDIGVSMGRIGTDVSREASDMVLADDNFATIVQAVEEGRRIFDNIRRFVRYLLTTNSGEVMVMFLAPIFGLPLPLTAIQILWINLVTDGLPAVALGLEPVGPKAMKRPPRPRRESILALWLWQHALRVGGLMAAIALAVQAVAKGSGWEWPTMVFTTVAFLQLGNALACRSETETYRSLARGNGWLLGALAVSAAAQLATVYVPHLQTLFGTKALTPLELGVVLLASSGAFVAVETGKLLKRRGPRHPRPGSSRS